ncbi:MAG: hypothetical protein K2K76_10885 [Muribaculaceae bacterium]|nr:hypothetical protein [Muribaculaceae bacterium]
MAKTLTISFGNSSFELTPKKVDRNRLYGYAELRGINPDGSFCYQASVNADGVNIICPGATKIGVMDDMGNWVDKQTLIPLMDDGSSPVRIPSSFDGGICLTREASLEELLDLTIQSVYQLSGEDALSLSGSLGESIFTFDFSYRGGYESNSAFLLANDYGVFMLVGTLGKYEYLGLDEVGELDNPDEDLNIEDGDLDFSMM